MPNLATDLALAMEFAKDQLQRHVDMLLQECDCEECPECGKLPHECSGTACAQTCQCTACDHCLATDAIDGLTDAIADLNTRAASGGDSASLEQRARELLAREYEGHGYADYARYIRSGAVLTNGIVIRAIAAALANQQGVGDAKDTERLNWLDAQNLQQRMGWKVSQAPAGNVSVQHVVFLGSEPVPIRVAIDAAMSAQPAGDVAPEVPDA